MKKIVLMLAAMALIAGTAQAEGYTPEAPGPELVTNGDFEDSTFVKDTVPTGWEHNATTSTWTSPTTGGAPGPTYTWRPGDSGSAVEWKGFVAPTKVVKVTGPTWSQAVLYSPSLGGMIQKNVPVSGNMPHLFSFDAKDAGTTTGAWSWFSVMVNWRDSADAELGYSNLWVGSYTWIVSPTSPTNGLTSMNAELVPGVDVTISSGGWWTMPEWIMTAPTGAVTANIHFMAYTGAVHLFDNVSLREIPEPLTLSLLGLGGLMLRKRR